MSKKKEELPPIGTWAQRERRYIVEWAEAKYPGAKKQFNVPIGPVPESVIQIFGFTKGTRFFRPYRPKVDCVIFLADKLIVAEAEIWVPKAALRDLILYKQLVPQTPEFSNYADKPNEFYLVMPERIGWVEEIAKQNNIKIDIFKPDWISEYVEMLGKYFTKEGALERAERKRRLGI
jgi:hypothetical protein